MDFQHLGSIEITGIQFKDTVASTVPFFQTTNATPNIHDNVWAGNSSVSGLTCYQDAIVCGGSGPSSGAGDNAFFQGYEGNIYRNFFHNIRRAVLLNPAANSTQVENNTVSASCGSGLYLGACIEIAGSFSEGLGVSGCKISGNCIETSYYPFAIKGAYFVGNEISGNGFWDPTAATIAYIYLDVNSTDNVIIDAFSANDALPTPSVPLLYDLSSNHTTVISPTGDSLTDVRGNSVLTTAVYVNSNAIGPLAYDKYGHAAGWQTQIYTGTYIAMQPYMVAANLVSDAAVTSGSSIITSATAAWTSAVINSPVYVGAALMGNTARVVWAFTPSTAWAWQPSYAYSTGDVARPTSANGHLYQASTGGTTSSSQPTWPTGGGTVTDGGVTWQDLSSATAVLTSHTSSTTASSQNCNWWNPAGAVQSGPLFTQNHIISQGNAPTVAVQAAAGSAASGTITGHDMAMKLSLTTGTSSVSSGELAIITYNITWGGGTPHVSLTPTNSAAAAMVNTAQTYLVASGSTIQLWANNTPGTAVTATFDINTMG